MKINKILAVTGALLLLITIIIYFLFQNSQSIDDKVSQEKTEDNISSRIKTSLDKKIQIEEGIVSKLSNENNKTEDYIVKCEWKDLNTEENKQKWKNSRLNVFEYLKQSKLENDKLLYALDSFNKKNKSNLLLLSEFIKEYPYNSFGQYSFLNQCLEQSDNPLCLNADSPEIQTLAEDNGYIWVNLALLRNARNQKEPALKALKKSLDSLIINTYQREYMKLYYEASLAAGEENDLFTRSNAFDFSVTIPEPGFSALSQFCKVEPLNTQIKINLCFEVTKAMATRGDTLILRSLGRDIHKRFKPELKKNKSELKGKVYSKEMLQFLKASNLMLHDAILDEYWFDAVIKHGEIQAQKMTIEEAIRLSKNPNYNPCTE